jgi:hypothetical protein
VFKVEYFLYIIQIMLQYIPSFNKVFQPKTKIFAQNPCFKYFNVRTHFWKIMTITSHMQNIIQIYPCILKLLRKQESVRDGQTDRRTDDRYYYIPHRYRGG